MSPESIYRFACWLEVRKNYIIANFALARGKVLMLCPSRISSGRRRRSSRFHIHSSQQLENLGLIPQQMSCESYSWSTETFHFSVSPFYFERLFACLLQYLTTLQTVSPQKLALALSFVLAWLLNQQVDVLLALCKGQPSVGRAFWTQSLLPQLQGLLSDRLYECHMKTFVSY